MGFGNSRSSPKGPFPALSCSLAPCPPRLSGLSGLEKQLYGFLLKLKESKESEEKQGHPDGYEQQLDLMISLLESKQEGRQV
jgi:hypothetical protein